MATNLFEKKLDMMRGAAKTAFASASNLSGRESDHELADYGKLKSTDFDQLASEFGVDTVADYIRNMEAKKMRRDSYA